MRAATIIANTRQTRVNRHNKPTLSLVSNDGTSTANKKLDTNVPEKARAFASALIKTHYPSTTAVVVVTGESWGRFQADAFEGQPLAWLDAQQNGYRAVWGSSGSQEAIRNPAASLLFPSRPKRGPRPSGGVGVEQRVVTVSADIV